MVVFLMAEFCKIPYSVNCLMIKSSIYHNQVLKIVAQEVYIILPLETRYILFEDIFPQAIRCKGAHGKTYFPTVDFPRAW